MFNRLLPAIGLLSCLSCTVDDDAIVVPDEYMQNSVLCCIDTFRLGLSASSLDLFNYSLGDSIVFINGFGTAHDFHVIENEVIEADRIVRVAAPPNIAADSLAYRVINNAKTIRLYSASLNFQIRIYSLNFFNYISFSEGFKDYDILIISTSRAALENNYSTVTDWKDYPNPNPNWGGRVEFLSQQRINDRIYTDLRAMSDRGTNRLYLSYTDGVVAFYDSASGEMWSLVD